MSIFIFSKSIHSGKTTELMNWCKHKKNCEGILMPDIDGLRKMYDIKSNFLFDAECNNPLVPNEELITIGKYHFYNDAFEKGNRIIIDALQQPTEYIIIDEVGKLELNKTGFYTSIKQAIEKIIKKEFKGNLLLVVRKDLLNEIVLFFQLDDFQVVEQLSF